MFGGHRRECPPAHTKLPECESALMGRQVYKRYCSAACERRDAGAVRTARVHAAVPAIAARCDVDPQLLHLIVEADARRSEAGACAARIGAPSPPDAVERPSTPPQLQQQPAGAPAAAAPGASAGQGGGAAGSSCAGAPAQSDEALSHGARLTRLDGGARAGPPATASSTPLDVEVQTAGAAAVAQPGPAAADASRGTDGPARRGLHADTTRKGSAAPAAARAARRPCCGAAWRTRALWRPTGRRRARPGAARWVPPAASWPRRRAPPAPPAPGSAEELQARAPPARLPASVPADWLASQAELWQSLGATVRALPTRAHPGCARAHTVHAAAAPDRPHAAARAAGACGVHQHERARRRRGQRCEHGPGRGPLPGAVHAQPLLSAELHVRVRAGCAPAVPRRAAPGRAGRP